MRMMSEVVAQKEAEAKKSEEVKAAGVPVTTDTTQATAPNDDIVTRVLRGNTAGDSTTKPAQPEVSEKFNPEDIDKIQDPAAKKYAEAAYKSFEKGYQKKFQELAEERKALENLKSEANKWTPERVQSLLSNQEFISASQAILSSANPTDGVMSDSEFSALSEKEKTEIKSMKMELLTMKQQNQAMQLKSELEKQDLELKGKYSNYDPAKVHSLRSDMLQGKINATSEHLWKVLDYEDAIRRAYTLGKEDRKAETQDKSSTSTVLDGNKTQRNDSVIERLPNESGKDYLMRIMQSKLAQKK